MLSLVVFLLVSFSAAVAGAFSPPGAWFESLHKPWFNPPGWLFGPVWTVLYATIGVSAWWVYRAHGWNGARVALAVWLVQMVFNAAWSPVFFGMQRPDLALWVMGGLWLSIIATMVSFWPLHRGAVVLLIPYLCWVSFAACLNVALWRLNP